MGLKDIDGIRSDMIVPTDPHTLVQATNLVMMVTLMVGCLFKWFALGPADPPLPGLLVVAISVANSIYLSHKGSHEVAAWVLIGLLFIGLIFVGYNAGGFMGPVVLMAPLIPLVAIFLINATAGCITVILVVAVLTVFFALHLNDGINHTGDNSTGVLVGRYLALVFSGLVSTWIACGFARTAQQLLATNQALANTDHLTGIANRRSLEDTLSLEVNRARRSGTWLSLIIIDVDHFKRFNDVNGHPAGDQCLIDIADVIDTCARRPTDLVGRFGGEEFLVILSDTVPEGALQIAERIRRSMLGRQIPYEPGQADMVTLSAGVISCQGNAISNVESLVQRADDALYQAKSLGRNRVVDVVILGDMSQTKNSVSSNQESEAMSIETPDKTRDEMQNQETDRKHLTVAG